MKYFIVNQNRTQKEEISGGYLWAPKDKKGRKQHHWDAMLKIEKGDIIFSNKGGYLSYYGIARGACYDFDNPFPTEDWDTSGRKVDVDYYKIEPTIKYSEHIRQLLYLQASKGAFNKGLRVNEGYLFSLSKGQFDYLFDLVNTTPIKMDVVQKIGKEDFLDFEETAEDEKQFQDIHIGKTKGYNKKQLDEIAEQRKHKKPCENTTVHNRVATDPHFKATCLENHNYQCEISKDHETFSNTTGLHQYMECHHLIPMKAQKDFPDLWLDDLFNLVCLCPLCHAQIHYGDRPSKEAVFWSIYHKRKTDFAKVGFNKQKMLEIFNEYYF